MSLFEPKPLELLRRTPPTKNGPISRERTTVSPPPNWERGKTPIPDVASDPEIFREFVVLLIAELIQVYSDAPASS